MSTLRGEENSPQNTPLRGRVNYLEEHASKSEKVVFQIRND